MTDWQHRLPFAAHWGAGTTSSSDGQRFRAGGRGEAMGQVNLRYGTEPGVLFYTHISDQYTPFYSKVIAANARDATYVLDGLLYHESDLRIEEHYTDTSGFTDHVFAIYLDFALRLVSATWPTNACMFLTRIANMWHLHH
jgi:TnpA family transposase